MIIAIAANFLVVTGIDGETDPEIQEPSSVIERVFASRMEYQDVGVDIEIRGNTPMYRIAYVSMCLHDGKFAEYLSEVLDAVYPWADSYYFELECSKGNETGGIKSENCWKSFTKTYETGYGDPISVTLELYR